MPLETRSLPFPYWFVCLPGVCEGRIAPHNRSRWELVRLIGQWPQVGAKASKWIMREAIRKNHRLERIIGCEMVTGAEKAKAKVIENGDSESCDNMHHYGGYLTLCGLVCVISGIHQALRFVYFRPAKEFLHRLRKARISNGTSVQVYDANMTVESYLIINSIRISRVKHCQRSIAEQAENETLEAWTTAGIGQYPQTPLQRESG